MKKKKEKTVMLYSVMCGLYAEESLFPPFPEHNANWTPDLNTAKRTYQRISIENFDKKEVLLAKLKGYNTYNKYISQVEVPAKIFNKAMRDELVYGYDGAINSCVWEEKVNHQFDNVKDELFEIEGGPSSLHIANVRKWTNKEIANL